MTYDLENKCQGQINILFQSWQIILSIDIDIEENFVKIFFDPISNYWGPPIFVASLIDLKKVHSHPLHYNSAKFCENQPDRSLDHEAD